MRCVENVGARARRMGTGWSVTGMSFHAGSNQPARA
jgi:hypothetical protein